VKQWLLETLVRHAPMGIAFVDLEFRFQLINDKLAAINGLPASAHLGRTIADVVPDLWPTADFPQSARHRSGGDRCGSVRRSRVDTGIHPALARGVLPGA